MGSLKIPKEQLEAVFWRMAKKKTTNHKKNTTWETKDLQHESYKTRE
jgi:hypothetical protein